MYYDDQPDLMMQSEDARYLKRYVEIYVCIVPSKIWASANFPKPVWKSMNLLKIPA